MQGGMFVKFKCLRAPIQSQWQIQIWHNIINSPEFVLQTCYIKDGNVILKCTGMPCLKKVLLSFSYKPTTMLFCLLFCSLQRTFPLQAEREKKNTLILRKLNNAEQRMSCIEKLNDKWKTDDWWYFGRHRLITNQSYKALWMLQYNSKALYKNQPITIYCYVTFAAPDSQITVTPLGHVVTPWGNCSCDIVLDK